MGDRKIITSLNRNDSIWMCHGTFETSPIDLQFYTIPAKVGSTCPPCGWLLQRLCSSVRQYVCPSVIILNSETMIAITRKTSILTKRNETSSRPFVSKHWRKQFRRYEWRKSFAEWLSLNDYTDKPAWWLFDGTQTAWETVYSILFHVSCGSEPLIERVWPCSDWDSHHLASMCLLASVPSLDAVDT